VTSGDAEGLPKGPRDGCARKFVMRVSLQSRKSERRLKGGGADLGNDLQKGRGSRKKQKEVREIRIQEGDRPVPMVQY